MTGGFPFDGDEKKIFGRRLKLLFVRIQNTKKRVK